MRYEFNPIDSEKTNPIDNERRSNLVEDRNAKTPLFRGWGPRLL